MVSLIGSLLPLPLVILYPFIPESPRFVFRKKNIIFMLLELFCNGLVEEFTIFRKFVYIMHLSNKLIKSVSFNLFRIAIKASILKNTV